MVRILHPDIVCDQVEVDMANSISFGKLTMTDTDLELVDTDPKDPFDFSVDHWDAQLVAGYSKTLPNRGLRAFLPDYNDVPRSRRRVS